MVDNPEEMKEIVKKIRELVVKSRNGIDEIKTKEEELKEKLDEEKQYKKIASLEKKIDDRTVKIGIHNDGDKIEIIFRMNREMFRKYMDKKDGVEQ